MLTYMTLEISNTLHTFAVSKLSRALRLITIAQIQRLRNAMQDYDNDRWRFVSSKVGNGFSAAACKAKAEEMEAEAMVADDGALSVSDDEPRDVVEHADSIDTGQASGP